jgi:cytochrome c oxidase assembly protein subunit 15
MTGVCHSPLMRRYVSPRVGKLASLASAVVCLQATLGITTLIYIVPTPLAACHQAGSVLLLTAMAALAVSLRRPSAAARQVRAALVHAGGPRPTKV